VCREFTSLIHHRQSTLEVFPMSARDASDGTRGQAPLPPPSPTDQGGNGLGAVTGYGRPTTQAPTNSNPQRGGTTVPQGQAGVAPKS
jgi:hypothetical protein